jgi:hypothetical protein
VMATKKRIVGMRISRERKYRLLGSGSLLLKTAMVQSSSTVRDEGPLHGP